MTHQAHNPLIDVKDLADIIGQPGVKVVDASWYLPSDQRYPIAEYEVAHIPGAKFFDIEAISDTSSAFPHMLPSEAVFAQAMVDMGIDNDDLVVVYDGSGVFSAPRLWWTLRVFGHNNVKVLNGGLPAWQANGGQVASLHNDYQPTSSGRFTCRFRPELVMNAQAVFASLDAQQLQIVDARTAARFNGEQEEPRPGVRSGHIPGSINLPFKMLLDEKGAMKPAADLQTCFYKAGIDLTKPIVTSCGSGITASVLALALYVMGYHDIPVYDGSWAEWGSCEQYPVVKKA